jgi:hypothetical protein
MGDHWQAKIDVPVRGTTRMLDAAKAVGWSVTGWSRQLATTLAMTFGSYFFPALVTGLGVFLVLFITQPPFILQKVIVEGTEDGGTGEQVYETVYLWKRIFALSGLLALLVATLPYVIQAVLYCGKQLGFFKTKQRSNSNSS